MPPDPPDAGPFELLFRGTTRPRRWRVVGRFASAQAAADGIDGPGDWRVRELTSTRAGAPAPAPEDTTDALPRE